MALRRPFKYSLLDEDEPCDSGEWFRSPSGSIRELSEDPGGSDRGKETGVNVNSGLVTGFLVFFFEANIDSRLTKLKPLAELVVRPVPAEAIGKSVSVFALESPLDSGVSAIVLFVYPSKTGVADMALEVMDGGASTEDPNDTTDPSDGSTEYAGPDVVVEFSPNCSFSRFKI